MLVAFTTDDMWLMFYLAGRFKLLFAG